METSQSVGGGMYISIVSQGSAQRPLSSLTNTPNGNNQKIGSQCPIVIKHQFQDESKNYIDDVIQVVTSTQKRFRYDPRAQSAKNHANTHKGKSATEQKQLLSEKGFTSPASEGVVNALSRPATASPGNQTRSDSASTQEMFARLINLNRQGNVEGKFKIKPAKKIDTFQIHSAIYRVKKQKETLDEQIQQLEEKKKTFNQNDFYLIANAGALDYIFNLQKGQLKGAPPEDNTYEGRTDTLSLTQNTRPITAISRPITAVSRPTTAVSRPLTAALSRPISSKTLSKVGGNDSPILQSDSTASKRIPGSTQKSKGSARTNNKPEYLRLNDEELERVDFEIIGNCYRSVKSNERRAEETWNSPQNQDDIIGQKVREFSQSLGNIQRVLQQGDNRSEGFQNQQDQQQQHQGQQKYKDEDQEEQLLEYELQQKVAAVQAGAFSFHQNALLQEREANGLQSPQMHQFQQPEMHQFQSPSERKFDSSGMLQQYPSSAKKSMESSGYATQMQPKSSAFAGLSRVQSAKVIKGSTKTNLRNGNTVYLNSAESQPQLLLQQQQHQRHAQSSSSFSQLLVNRPQTAHLRQGPRPALLSYGPTKAMKQRILRNFDHLELARLHKLREIEKELYERHKSKFQKQQNHLRVEGHKLDVLVDTYKNLLLQSHDAMEKWTELGISKFKPDRELLLHLAEQYPLQEVVPGRAQNTEFARLRPLTAQAAFTANAQFFSNAPQINNSYNNNNNQGQKINTTSHLGMSDNTLAAYQQQIMVREEEAFALAALQEQMGSDGVAQWQNIQTFKKQNTEVRKNEDYFEADVYGSAPKNTGSLSQLRRPMTAVRK